MNSSKLRTTDARANNVKHINLDINRNNLVPHDYHFLVSEKHLPHDLHLVKVNRYQKNPKEELGGEHFSVSREVGTNRLFGMMFLDLSLDTFVLPTEDEAEVALNFIAEHAGDIADSVEVRWIKPLLREPQNPPHDVPFKLGRNHVQAQITGVRVKMFDKAAEKFLWVIVGKDKQVISFERNISWDYTNKCRITERWLHDNWLIENSLKK